MTGGFAMPRPTASTDAARQDYARQFVLRLDSVLNATVEVFRGTSGLPRGGATGPEVLAARERDRWERCRNFYWDLTTYSPAARAIAQAWTQQVSVAQGAAVLDTALAGLDAVTGCDNIASMIAAPQRWAPWQSNYEENARRFYAGWYSELRAVHQALRGFARELNGVLPADRRLTVPPALPPTAPYAR
jgi:hypothetical protein